MNYDFNDDYHNDSNCHNFVDIAHYETPVKKCLFYFIYETPEHNKLAQVNKQDILFAVIACATRIVTLVLPCITCYTTYNGPAVIKCY